MLVVGILWCLFLVYAIALLLPPVMRRLRAWELRSKPVSRTPSYPQRILFLLLALLMAVVALADAFHRDLRATIGVSSGMACSLMIILPALYLVLEARRKIHKNGKGTDVTVK